MKPPRKRRGGLIVPLLLLAASAVLFWQRQNVYDWYRLRSYSVSVTIEGLAQDSGMSDLGTKLFYVQRPVLLDKSDFQLTCDVGEKTIVLGCYISREGIYVLDVTDERLAGIEEVTAAHEMLHAAYDRLGKREKQTVNELLDEAYATVTNERIKKTIDNYRSSGADVSNELHSILGTEVRTLPEELETYYKKYFTDRLAVVTLSEKYETVFTERENKIASYDGQLSVLKAEIEAQEVSLKQQEASLEADRAQLDALLASQSFDAYNSRVPGFNSKVRSYNSLIADTQNKINTYNSLLSERNAIALEEQELYKAIDTRLTPVDAR